MTPDIHNAMLDFELHRDILERSCGRGGAPQNTARARAELPHVEAALRALKALLQKAE